jgi:hypothetical protein
VSGVRRCSRPGCTDRVVGRRLCHKHYQAAWKAGDFTNAPLLPRKRARVVCPPEHKHGASSTCYIQHQCRCNPCRDKRAAMERARSRAKAYGRFDRGVVDADPIREHMMLLAEFGIGYKRVAALAGIGITPARNLIWGRQDPGPRYGELQKHVKRETAEAILAVKPDIENLAGGARIPARGTHRRVQALVTLGWSQSKLAERLGMERSNFGTMMQRDHVTARLHRAVEALFEELWDREPPRAEWRDKIAYSRTLRFAHERRWLPPLAWDDIDNDVEPPVAEAEEGAVDEMAIELACMGERVRLSPLERREAVRRLNRMHLDDTVIAERVRIEKRNVLRIRQELGIPAAVGADRQVVA